MFRNRGRRKRRSGRRLIFTGQRSKRAPRSQASGGSILWWTIIDFRIDVTIFFNT